MMRPFPDGLITPDAYKAMVLQLDPDGQDDEIELAIRRGIEDEFAAELERELNRQLNQLIPPGATDEQVRAAANAVEETSGRVRDVLRRELARSADLGVSVSFDTLANIGMAFDWTLAHTEAARFAGDYAFDLVRQINDTTRNRLQVAIGEWFQNGDTLPQLRKELAPLFGERRARLIAQTETTRAAAEGSLIGYRESGVVEQVEIRTSRDERVCPVCGPIAEEGPYPLESGAPGRGFPPFHVGCRCWIVPVVPEPGD